MAVGALGGRSSVMNDSWAIGLPGQSTIGTRVRLVISSVSVPVEARVDEAGGRVDDQPEAPERGLALDPRDDVVGQLDVLLGGAEARTRRGGSRTARPRRPRSRSVRLLGGSRGRSPRRGGCGTRGTSCPRRRSTLAGWTMPSSQGSIDDAALGHEAADRAVGEDGGRGHARSLPGAAAGPRGARGRARPSGCAGARRGAGAPCGPRRGRRGNGSRRWRSGRLVPPSSSPAGCASLSGVACTAHQTSHSSAISGIFSANISQMKPQSTFAMLPPKGAARTG